MSRSLPLLAAFALSGCAAAAPPPASLTGTCPVISSTDWGAWVSILPGRMNSGATLHVAGRVTLPSGDWTARLRNIRVLESYPSQVIVELEAASSGAGIQVPLERDVRGSWKVEPAVGSVTVTCRGSTLVHIAPVETAH